MMKKGDLPKFYVASWVDDDPPILYEIEGEALLGGEDCKICIRKAHASTLNALENEKWLLDCWDEDGDEIFIFIKNITAKSTEEGNSEHQLMDDKEFLIFDTSTIQVFTERPRSLPINPPSLLQDEECRTTNKVRCPPCVYFVVHEGGRITLYEITKEEFEKGVYLKEEGNNCGQVITPCSRRASSTDVFFDLIGDSLCLRGTSNSIFLNGIRLDIWWIYWVPYLRDRDRIKVQGAFIQVFFKPRPWFANLAKGSLFFAPEIRFLDTKKSNDPTVRSPISPSRSDGIFISYRQTDTSYISGSLYEKLSGAFGEHRVFKDIDTIPLGADFRQYIEQAIEQARVVLAVIGPSWLTVTNDGGERRLDDPTDFVRIELEHAMQCKIPVIPLFVQGVHSLDPKDLPITLSWLAYRQGLSLRPGRDFNRDIQTLVEAINRLLEN